LAQSGDPAGSTAAVEDPMKRIACLTESDGDASPIYGVKIPAGYRDWRLISVKQLAGNKLKQLRAQLGNDIAIEAFREGKLPFPDFVGRKRNALLYEIGIHSLPLR